MCALFISSSAHSTKMAGKKKGWGVWAQHTKPQTDENVEDELLVFGYSCKLFRDDEKALHIDQGKHLIPWMGDDSLMIDRYDGRGYLPELECHEAKPDQEVVEMNEEEMKMEEVCEEERWMALKKDMAEEEMYQEEEMKRLRAELASDSVYREVGFSYADLDQNPANVEPEVRPPEPPEVDFLAPAELGVPEGMTTPKTSKMNAIIEKTALFISKHGPQMEIVIKTKQANNPQFDFLVFEHELNRYYKHMVQAIKQGKYVPKPHETRSADGSSGSDDEGSDGEHYLHPSLLSKHVQAEEVSVTIPKIHYTRKEDDLYARLVSQLKDKLANSTSTVNATNVHFHQVQEVNNATLCAAAAPGAPTSYLDLTVLYNQPPPPGLETSLKVQLPGQGSSTPSMTQEIASEPYLVPPSEVQPIIDKMAVYVAKNGADFEAIVRNKGDGRFEFLNPWHEYHNYYQLKRRECEERMAKENAVAEATRQAMATAAALNRVLAKEQIERTAAGPISFSIKPKENEGPSDRRTSCALGGGSDSESEEGKSTHPAAEEKFIMKADPSIPAPPPPKLIVIDPKQAEEIRARMMAAAAKEKTTASSEAKERERQLQLERKRKAMLFLSKMLKKEGDGPKEDPEAATGPNGLAEASTATADGTVPVTKRVDGIEDEVVLSAKDVTRVDKEPSSSAAKREGSRERSRAGTRDRDRSKERDTSGRKSKEKDKEKEKEKEREKSKDREKQRTSPRHRRSRSRSHFEEGKSRSSSKKYFSRKRSRSQSPAKPSKRRSPRRKRERTKSRSPSRDRRRRRSRSHRRKATGSSRRSSRSRRRRDKDTGSRRKARRSSSSWSSSCDSSRSRSRSRSRSGSMSESKSKTRSRSGSAPAPTEAANDKPPSSND